jgi:hypothetical protein
VAQVLERDYAGESARFKARLPPHYREEFAAYILPPGNKPSGAKAGARGGAAHCAA